MVPSGDLESFDWLVRGAASVATITVSNMSGVIPYPIISRSGELATGAVRLGMFADGENIFDGRTVFSSSFR